MSLEIARELKDIGIEASVCLHLARSYRAQGQSQLADGLLLQHANLAGRGGRNEAGSDGKGWQAGLAEWITAVFEHRFQAKQALKEERQLALARIRHGPLPVTHA